MTDQTGLLVTVAGATAEIEDDTGQRIPCHVRKNADTVITGDRVYWQLQADGSGIITGHAPRKSLLYRPENAHKRKLIAANIDCLLIVTAPPPVLSEDNLDRFLIAAEILKLTPLIIFNKTDLLDDTQRAAIDTRLNVYQKIGYAVIFTSIYQRETLTALAQHIDHRAVALTGSSGVGKSSLIAALTGEARVRTGAVSNSSGLGRHTTTTTRLYHLPDGGSLIDSPGVREFGLWQLTLQELSQGFPEFKPFMGECKFRDCAHMREPNCAIQAGVTAGKIAAGRFANYQKLYQAIKAK
jgi:ribosome biogenesis GTPase